jgi:VIT1/CCC1 family predicted Fe2+/Mn2+ transporter
MVLTFTLSLGAAAGDAVSVRAVLLGALGCNLAWGIIDAVLYLMGIRADRALGAASIRAIRATRDNVAAHALIAGNLPTLAMQALAPADLERIRRHLIALPEGALEVRLGKADYVAAVGVFLLVTSCVFPLSLPFFFLDDVRAALRISNAIALALLFLTGFTFGRHTGRPWSVGFAMVAVGVALVWIAIALGG